MRASALVPRIDAAEAGASVADLGTILPIGAALVLVNGVDAAAAFGVAGVLFVVAALVYRVPVPVQPIKAAAAIAISTHARPSVIAAAAVLIGAVLVAIWLLRAAPLLLRLFPKPIIRGNQLGVGVLLVIAAADLVRRDGGSPSSLAVAAIMALAVAASGRRRAPLAVVLVGAGVLYSIVDRGVAGIALDPSLPGFAWPSRADMGVAFTLLVIPQLPLTLSNAIVGTADLERDYFGARAARVSAGRLSLTSGLANLLAGGLGGMPLCHGSSGLTAYYRMGARTGGVGVVAGLALVAVAVLFGATTPAVFELFPRTVLAALLAAAGLQHALLVLDLRGRALLVALVTGAVGVATKNLAWGMAAGLPLAFVLIPSTRHRAARGR